MQYATKEEAALAMKKMIFETSIGSMLEIDFYQSKESRLQEMEEQNNKIKQAFEMSKHLQKFDLSSLITPPKAKKVRNKRKVSRNRSIEKVTLTNQNTHKSERKSGSRSASKPKMQYRAK